MGNSPNQRLCEFCKFKAVSGTLLAEQLGTSQPTVSAILSGKRNLSRGMVARITERYPDLNSNWLMTGEGNMLNDVVVEVASDVQKMQETDVSAGKAVLTPLIPASAFAGGIRGFAPDSAMLKNCEKIVSPVQGAEYAIPITGDSMEPDYPDGAIAYIKSINEEAFIPWGHTVILDTENGAFIKKIYPDDQDQKYVWAKSINPEYPPLHIPKTSIFRMFRVLGTSRIFTTM